MTPAFRYGFAVKCAQLKLNQEQAEYLFSQLPIEKSAGEAPTDVDPGMLAQLQQYLGTHPEIMSALQGGLPGAAVGAGAGAALGGKDKRGLGAGLGALAGGAAGAGAGALGGISNSPELQQLSALISGGTSS